MTHSHSKRWKPALFRVFVTNRYYENRDEYVAHGQTQPYTFEEYVRNNLNKLKKDFRLTYHKKDRKL